MGLIYKIVNSVNTKVYVGKTTDTFGTRWSQHKSRARHTYRNHYLYNAMRKHGIDNFSMVVLEEVPDENLDVREMAWIAELNAANAKFGYNCTPGGEGAKHGPSSKCRQKGWRALSDATKEKISKAHKGRKQSPEAIEKIRRGLTGKKQPPEAIANRANSLRVAFAKPEVKAKLSKVAKERCANGNRFWEHITPESLARAKETRRLWFAVPENKARWMASRFPNKKQMAQVA